MKNESGFGWHNFEQSEQQHVAREHRQLYLVQARALLKAASSSEASGGTWPVLVQDWDGTTLLRGELPSLHAVQGLREDLASLGYRQVAGASEAIYVFRLHEGG